MGHNRSYRLPDDPKAYETYSYGSKEKISETFGPYTYAPPAPKVHEMQGAWRHEIYLLRYLAGIQIFCVQTIFHCKATSYGNEDVASLTGHRGKLNFVAAPRSLQKSVAVNIYVTFNTVLWKELPIGKSEDIRMCGKQSRDSNICVIQTHKDEYSSC